MHLLPEPSERDNRQPLGSGVHDHEAKLIMERLNRYLESLVKDYHAVQKSGADWAKENFYLGKIEGCRQAIRLIQGTDSVVPSELI